MGYTDEMLNVKEFKDRSILKALGAEFIGNLLLNFFGCAACSSGDGVRIALTFGLVVFVIIMIIGHISGGHVNPAVTIGLLVGGKISIPKAVLYIIAQCLGAITGSAILYGVTDVKTFGVTKVNQIGDGQAFGVEFFLGFILVLTVFGVCDQNKPELKSTAPLAIGLSIAVGHLGTVNLTGSSMNPARSFGAAVIANFWKHHWVYWVGPIFGGIVAALLYTFVLAAPSLGPLKIIERYTTVVTDEKELRRLDEKLEKLNDNLS